VRALRSQVPLVRFGNPANSESPVALRPLLAKGLPLSSATNSGTEQLST
jgi:hypothetical protein